MLNTTKHRSHGTIEAIIFDWAGTTVDHGCMAPVAAFREVFRRRGVEISVAEARGPMGTHKREHIRQLTEKADIRARWVAVHGFAPGDGVVEEMFREFVPLQLDVLAQHAEPIEGCIDAMAELRSQGLKIGSTTGFTGEMMDILVPEARKRGFSPDYVVSASDVPAGRPMPYMALRNVIELGISHVEHCVKVDDTEAGILEGLAAGMWTVGVVESGNELGLTRDELLALSTEERSRLRAAGHAKLRKVGAHHTIDSIAQLPACLESIRDVAMRGGRP